MAKFAASSVFVVLALMSAATSFAAGARPRKRTADNAALIEAVQKGQARVIVNLLGRGTDINAEDAVIKWTPLHWAAAHGPTEILGLLLDRGAKVNAKSSDNGATPLHTAVSNGQADAARILLERDADANAADSFGFTPLHAVVRDCGDRHLGVLRLLLEHGAKVNAADNEGRTPLDIAGGRRKEEARRVLMAQGGGPGIKVPAKTAPPRKAAPSVVRTFDVGRDGSTLVIEMPWELDYAWGYLESHGLDVVHALRRGAARAEVAMVSTTKTPEQSMDALLESHRKKSPLNPKVAPTHLRLDNGVRLYYSKSRFPNAYFRAGFPGDRSYVCEGFFALQGRNYYFVMAAPEQALAETQEFARLCDDFLRVLGTLKRPDPPASKFTHF
ncbi:MAG: ankyrin repeat domain-containing protein [Elusimicrobia bacterium]|nr:ankyrin repeat domain-containing protein [Elusimicrobiota bacterium]